VSVKMRRGLMVLGAVGLLTALVQSRFITQPGYMDACYAYNGGRALAAGQGWNDPYLWNYLDDPAALPHPAHLYWMPLPSFIAAVGMWLGGLSFRAGQAPFILLAGLLPLLTAWTAWSLLQDERRAIVAGILAAFPGFYAAYSTTTDGFALYAIIATGVFLAVGEALARRRADLWIAVGALLGLAHLTRADGLLLTAVVLAFVWIQVPRRLPNDPPAHMARRAAGSRLLAAALILGGYLAVSGVWYVRNLLELGSLFPGGGLRTLWLTEYDEFFHYPAYELNLAHLAASGWAAILRARGLALLQNFQTFAFVQGWLVLAPFVIVGWWQARARREVSLAVWYLLALFAAMTFVFPWPGMRGGFFHSSSAFIPLAATAASAGLAKSVAWLAARRGWVLRHAAIVFDAAVVLLAVGITLVLFGMRVLGMSDAAAWAKQDQEYVAIGEVIRAKDAGALVVAVNNPPCFFYLSNIPAVVIPEGGEAALRAVVVRYGVTHVVVDSNLPVDLAPLFAGGAHPVWLTPIAEVGGERREITQVYRVVKP
jgi:Dolichyl-phosphate-mannose-protein mannosyltransferase